MNSWSLKSLWWIVYQIQHVFYNLELQISFSAWVNGLCPSWLFLLATETFYISSWLRRLWKKTALLKHPKIWGLVTFLRLFYEDCEVLPVIPNTDVILRAINSTAIRRYLLQESLVVQLQKTMCDDAKKDHLCTHKSWSKVTWTVLILVFPKFGELDFAILIFFWYWSSW